MPENAPPDAEHLRLLQEAYDAQGRRLVEERLAMADRCDEALRRAEAAEAELADARAELERLRRTRTFRWSRAARDLYGRVRGGPGPGRR